MTTIRSEDNHGRKCIEVEYNIPSGQQQVSFFFVVFTDTGKINPITLKQRTELVYCMNWQEVCKSQS